MKIRDEVSPCGSRWLKRMKYAQLFFKDRVQVYWKNLVSRKGYLIRIWMCSNRFLIQLCIVWHNFFRHMNSTDRFFLLFLRILPQNWSLLTKFCICFHHICTMFIYNCSYTYLLIITLKFKQLNPIIQYHSVPRFSR